MLTEYARELSAAEINANRADLRGTTDARAVLDGWPQSISYLLFVKNTFVLLAFPVR
jgi:hypothetical protein